MPDPMSSGPDDICAFLEVMHLRMFGDHAGVLVLWRSIVTAVSDAVSFW